MVFNLMKGKTKHPRVSLRTLNCREKSMAVRIQGA